MPFKANNAASPANLGTSLALTILFSCVVVSAIDSGETAESLLARFKSEAGEAWKSLELADQSPATIKVNVKLEHLRNGQLKSTSDKDVLVKRKANHFLLQESQAGAAMIYGQNPSYRFLIGKKAANEGWLLMQFILKGPAGFPEVDLQLAEYLTPNTWSYQDMSLAALVGGPRFKALSAERNEQDGVRIHYQTAVRVGKKDIGLRGWMDLDPSNSWMLQGCEFKLSDGDSVTKVARSFAGSPKDGVRPCIFSEANSRYPATHDHMKGTAHYEIVNSDTPAEAEFYLSHYGLPEPRGVEPPSSNSWFVRILFIGASLLVLGLFLRRLTQRFGSRQIASSN